jgi:hypothetical protein
MEGIESPRAYYRSNQPDCPIHARAFNDTSADSKFDSVRVLGEADRSTDLK